jgi:amino acid transporter
MTATGHTEQKRSVGLIGGTAIGIGGMVGGGIFAVLGVAATQAGGATPIAFLLAGAVAALTAFSYAKLSVRFQSAGGTVTFVDRVFGIGEITGSLNIVLWVGYIATTALYAAAFGNYAATLFPGGTDPNPILLRGLVLIGVLIPWVINLANASLISRSESIVVAIKLSILMLVIAAGFPTVSAARLEPSTWPSPFSILAAGMLIFVAYEGFELIANASADMKRPKRNLPLAFAFSVGIVIVLYVLISIVVVGAMSPAQIAESADFALAEAASQSLGHVGFTLVAISAVLATFSAINATLYGSARLSFTIATEGELPDEFEKRTWNQPIGLHITATMGVLIAIALPLSSISRLSSAIFLTVFAVVNAAAFHAAASRAVAQKIVSALGLAGCAGSLAVLLVQSTTKDPISMVALVVLVGTALTVEMLVLRNRRSGPIAAPRTKARP